jgi:hypothetical protein
LGRQMDPQVRRWGGLGPAARQMLCSRRGCHSQPATPNPTRLCAPPSVLRSACAAQRAARAVRAADGRHLPSEVQAAAGRGGGQAGAAQRRHRGEGAGQLPTSCRPAPQKPAHGGDLAAPQHTPTFLSLASQQCQTAHPRLRPPPRPAQREPAAPGSPAQRSGCRLLLPPPPLAYVLQCKTRLDTHFQNVENVIGYYRDCCVEVRGVCCCRRCGGGVRACAGERRLRAARDPTKRRTPAGRRAIASISPTHQRDDRGGAAVARTAAQISARGEHTACCHTA